MPKQFCSLAGGHTLLQDALQRAGEFLEAVERICRADDEMYKSKNQPGFFVTV